MGSDITQALIESAIETETKKLAKATDSDLRERLRVRLEGLTKHYEELYSQPDPELLSSEDLDTIIKRLKDIVREHSST